MIVSRATDCGVTVAKLLTDIISQAVKPLQVMEAVPLHVMEDIKSTALKLITTDGRDLTKQLITLYGGKKQAVAGIKELDGFVCGIKSIKKCIASVGIGLSGRLI